MQKGRAGSDYSPVRGRNHDKETETYADTDTDFICIACTFESSRDFASGAVTGSVPEWIALLSDTVSDCRMGYSVSCCQKYPQRTDF